MKQTQGADARRFVVLRSTTNSMPQRTTSREPDSFRRAAKALRSKARGVNSRAIRCIESALRSEDYAARLNGDEHS